MKRKLLLAALCVVGAWGSHANADDVYKDVTGTYLKNANFEGEYTEYSRPRNDGNEARAIYKPDEWIVSYTSGNENDITALNSNCLQWNNFNTRAQLEAGGNNTYWVRQKFGTPTLELSQTVTLPLGTYTLSAQLYKGGLGGDGYIFVGSKTATKENGETWQQVSVTDFTSDGLTGTKMGFVATHTSAGSEKILGYDNFVLQWNLTKSLQTVIETANNLYEEGGSTDATLKAAIDDADAVKASSDPYVLENAYNTLFAALAPAKAKKDWNAAKTAAEAARDNGDYSNVTGSEKTALLAEIAKSEPTTTEGYNTAREALESATSTFTAAKTNYDALVAKKTEAAAYTTVAWPYATTAKKTALDTAVDVTPTSSEDAATKTAAITTAIRQFVESSGNAEGVAVAVDKTSSLLVYDATVGTSGWTSGSIGTNSGQSYIDGNGNTTSKYFDGGWSSTAGVNITLTQQLTLPEGQYLLQITARGSDALTTYTMSVGETSVDLPTDGSSGGTFGRGWSDKYLTFTSDGAPVTLTIAATSTAAYQWISFNRLRLHKLDATLADATDYANLNTAITTAENNTLGFQKDEYAPYKNIDALAKLAAAKAIDPTANNVKSDVQEVTAALNGATWTGNTEEVNGIYNGDWANSTPNTASGVNVDVPGWTIVDGMRLLIGDKATDPGLEYASENKALFSWGGTTMTYGEQAGYTLPLKANTVYELTYKIAAWRDGDAPSWVSLTVDNATVFGDNSVGTVGKINATDANPFAEKTFRFKTGDAGDYVVKLYANKHFVVTDLELYKRADLDIVKAYKEFDGYKTFYNSTDVNYQAPDGTTVYTAAAPANGYVHLTEAGSIVPAGEAVILKTTLVKDKDDNNVDTDIILTQTDADPTVANAEIFNNNNLHAAEDNTVSNVYILACTNTLSYGFYYFTGKLNAGEVYLTGPVPATSGAPARMIIVADGDATAINGVKAEAGKANEATYNMAGQRVNGSYKGIVIKNGKKYMNK